MRKIELLNYLIIGLLVALLPTQLGFHFWPDWAIVNGRLIDYFSPTLYLTDLLVFLLLATEIGRMRGSVLSITAKPRLLILFWLLTLFILLNCYFSYSPAVSAYKWLKVLEFVFLFFCLRRTMHPDKFLFIPVLLSVFYESLLAFCQFVQQSSVGGLWYFLGERSYSITTPGIATVQFAGQQLLRSYGTFSHPNVLGGFLAVVLPLILMWLLKQKVKRIIFFAWTILLSGYLTLLLSFSRTAIVIGLIFSAIAVLRHMKLTRKSVVLLGLALIPLLVFFLSLFSLGTGTESFSVRSQLNNIAIREWIKSPLFGTGLGASPLYTLTTNYQLRTTNYSLVGQPVHNIYLLLLSETGLVGLICFIGLLIYWFIHKPLAASRWPLAAILVLGLFDHYFLTSQQGLMLFVLILSL